MQIYYVLCNVRLFQGLKNIIFFTVVPKKYRCCQSSVVSVSLFQFIYIWNTKFLCLFFTKCLPKIENDFPVTHCGRIFFMEQVGPMDFTGLQLLPTNELFNEHKFGHIRFAHIRFGHIRFVP